jgi:hypothetical protein
MTPAVWDERGCDFCQSQQFDQAIAAFDQALAGVAEWRYDFAKF